MKLPYRWRKALAGVILMLTGSVSQGQENLRILPFPENPYHYALDWQGVPGRTYFLQASHDLKTWIYLGPIHSGTGQRLQHGIQSIAEEYFVRLQHTDIPVADTMSADFDDDGLSNQEEVASGTNPLAQDTDGDGYTDGYELENSTSPLDAAEMPAPTTRLLVARRTVSYDYDDYEWLPPEDRGYISRSANWLNPTVAGQVLGSQKAFSELDEWLTAQADFPSTPPAIPDEVRYPFEVISTTGEAVVMPNPDCFHASLDHRRIWVEIQPISNEAKTFRFMTITRRSLDGVEEPLWEGGTSLVVPSGKRLSVPFDITPGFIHSPQLGGLPHHESVVTDVLPIQTRVIGRDDPNTTWEGAWHHPGAEATAYTSPQIPGTTELVKNGDLISWAIPLYTELGVPTVSWKATGPGGVLVEGPQGGPVEAKEWKLEQPLEWKPGNWTVNVKLEFPDSRSAEFSFSEKLGYRTPDIMVIGWIAGDQLELQAAEAALAPIDSLGFPSPYSIATIMGTPGLQDLFLAAVATRVLHSCPLEPEGARNYANQYLMIESANEPPIVSFLDINKPMPFGGLGVDYEAIKDFKADTDKFRSFHRFQARYLVDQNGGILGQPLLLNPGDTSVGVTPLPPPRPSILGELGPINNHVNFGGPPIIFNPLSNLARIASLPESFEQYTQGRIGWEGQIVNRGLNGREVPWIWSAIRFEGSASLGASLPTPGHEVFPVYWIYANGARIAAPPNQISNEKLKEFIEFGEVAP